MLSGLASNLNNKTMHPLNGQFVNAVTGSAQPAAVDPATGAVLTTGASAGGAEITTSAGSGSSSYTAKPAGVNADGTSAYLSGTAIAVTGLSFLFTKYDIVLVEQIPTSGETTTFTKVNDFVVTGTLGSQVITIATGQFSASDTFEVYLSADVKGFDKTNNAWRFEKVNSTFEEMLNEDIASAPNSTVDYYFSMSEKEVYDIQFEKVSGVDTVDVKIYSSNDNDSIADASKTYIDTSLNGHGIASSGALAAAYTDDFSLYMGLGRRPVTVKVAVTWAGANIDGAYKLIATAR